MSETDLQRAILRAIEVYGAWAWRVNSGRAGKLRLAPPGTPDICVVSPAGWIEVKIPGGRLSPAQVSWHERAASEGVRAVVVSSVGEAVTIVRDWAFEDGMHQQAMAERSES